MPPCPCRLFSTSIEIVFAGLQGLQVDIHLQQFFTFITGHNAQVRGQLEQINQVL